MNRFHSIHDRHGRERLSYDYRNSARTEIIFLLFIGHAGNDNHRYGIEPRRAFHSTDKRFPVHFGHIEVGKDKVRSFFPENIESLAPVDGFHEFCVPEAGYFKAAADYHPRGCRIIDYKDSFPHYYLPPKP